MGLIITPQAEIDNYFESPALSQSLLKRLLGGMFNYLHCKKNEKELYYTEKGHFIIGSAVDIILTGEEGEFDRQYYVSQIEKKPSDVEMSIIQKVFDEAVLCNTHLTNILSDHLPQIEESILEHNWQANWKIETKINKIIDVGTEYWEDLKAGYGKQVLSVDEQYKIDAIVSSLVNNSRTNKYFDRDSFIRNSLTDIYYQLPVYFKYRGVDCKALLDMVIVIKDIDGYITEIKPIDLKTMSGNTLQFTDNLKRFRYDIQCAFYYEALKRQSSKLFGITSLNFEFLWNDFKFIVESSDYPGTPLVYTVDNHLLNIGKNGMQEHTVKKFDKSTSVDIKIPISKKIIGFDELIDTYIYQSNNNWLEEELITKHDGEFTINWYGIINK
jgi:hypothetical protein